MNEGFLMIGLFNLTHSLEILEFISWPALAKEDWAKAVFIGTELIVLSHEICARFFEWQVKRPLKTRLQQLAQRASYRNQTKFCEAKHNQAEALLRLSNNVAEGHNNKEGNPRAHWQIW